VQRIGKGSKGVWIATKRVNPNGKSAEDKIVFRVKKGRKYRIMVKAKLTDSRPLVGSYLIKLRTQRPQKSVRIYPPAIDVVLADYSRRRR
jgi:hypothetical protein